MSSTRHRLRNTATAFLAVALACVGSTAVLRTLHDDGPQRTVQGPASVHGVGLDPGISGLDAVETGAARKLVEMRAQRLADLACEGPSYPSRPC